MVFLSFFDERRDEGFQRGADVDDQIGFGDGLYVAGFALITVRRALFDEQDGFADAVHDLCDQGVQRLDGGDDLRRGKGMAGG